MTNAHSSPDIATLREALMEIANRASNLADKDAAEWMPSIYSIACKAVGEDPEPLLKATGFDGEPKTWPTRSSADIAELIAAKASEPAFVEFAKRMPKLNEAGLLPIIKVGPTAVSDWRVVLMSGREINLTDAEWQSAKAAAIGDDAQPKLDPIELAAWLCALEDAECYKPVSKSLIEHGRMYIRAGMTEEHCGDCTNQSHSCVVCGTDGYLLHARQIIEALTLPSTDRQRRYDETGEEYEARVGRLSLSSPDRGGGNG